jgi:acetyl-CoA acetyltransferase family protein
MSIWVKTVNIKDLIREGDFRACAEGVKERLVEAFPGWEADPDLRAVINALSAAEDIEEVNDALDALYDWANANKIRDTSLEKIASLEPSFGPNGVHHAGNSSQITDGAAAVLLMARERADELGIKPRARIVGQAVVGSDPVLMLTGPITATPKVLKKAGLELKDIDLIEINEAFASVILAWKREVNPDMSKVNVNGGAIALGHPLGATGARLMTTLLHELERTGGRYGMQLMCCGGGLGTATIIERLD